MERDIYFENRKVGIAKAEKCGLYYKIRCECRINEVGFHRIYAKGNAGEADLGICLRKECTLYLQKSVPVNDLGSELLSFHLERGLNPTDEVRIPLETENAFSEFPNLENATLLETNDRMILIDRVVQ